MKTDGNNQRDVWPDGNDSTHPTRRLSAPDGCDIDLLIYLETK